ncbi:helix-turn-helix domain-containing protein [Streptomyces sp. NPDC047023]|uniref:helix-turn-helix domain-containing protein n=1 Tax=Streptomyces sp. NPDC047023 TaxID=3155139 RepID=UPI0033F0DE04
MQRSGRGLCSMPPSFLRRVRLAHAQADLEAADPASGVTVAEIAARWGLWNAGRFAAAYRIECGAPPAAALRQE